MIDAATIGITLALNNGVSDGIAQIRRELAALDVAVAASSAGLTTLAAQGAGLAAPARAAAALLPALPRTAPAVAREEVAAPSAPAPAEVAIAEPAVPTAPLSEAPEARPASVPVVTPLPDFTPFGRTLAARAVAEGPGTAISAPSTAGPAMPPPAPLVAPMPLPPSPRMPDLEADNVGLRASAAPIAPPVIAPGALAASVPQAAGGANTRGVLPAARETAAQEGAIYMDGDLIGRFIADHLAEVATRAPAGATAFDPRLSPNWSGLGGVA